MMVREIAPLPALQSMVECIWTVETEPGEQAVAIEPVLPDGCPELVMQFGAPFERLPAGAAAERQADILFAGQLTGQLVLRPTGAVATLGVRFRPAGAAAFLHVSQQPLLGKTLGMERIDGALFRQLRTIRDTSRSLSQAVDRIQRCLLMHLDEDWLDSRVLAAVDAIRRSGGQVSIDVIATHAGMTRRHLERRFATLVGISPKRLARIVRFQRALRMLRAWPENAHRQRWRDTGATTALECGYADQPHFIREFTELAGCSPGAHLLRHAELSGFFTRTRHAGPASVEGPAGTQ